MSRIDGFKAIAAVLSECWQREVSVVSAWRYAKSDVDPLPHWYIRGRAFADRIELERWAYGSYIWRVKNK